ncbi:unnamed protein product, partial [Staurois parvus]
SLPLPCLSPSPFLSLPLLSISPPPPPPPSPSHSSISPLLSLSPPPLSPLLISPPSLFTWGEMSVRLMERPAQYSRRCCMSAVSGHLLYYVRSLWSSPVPCPQSLVISRTVSAVSGHLQYCVCICS